MNRIVKKTTVITLILTLMLALFGCGASVDCIYTVDAYGRNYQYNIVLPVEMVDALEEGATANGLGKWTVEDYLSTLSVITSATYYGKTEDGGDIVYILLRSSVESNESGDEGESAKPEVTKGFLQNRYRYITDNPFNGLRAEYDDGEGEGVMSILKKGVTVTRGNTEVKLPAFSEAFPVSQTLGDLSNITLNFYWLNNNIETINGEPYSDFFSGKKGAVWQSKFDLEDRNIEYYYYAPNPWGWYLIILAIGVAVTLIIILTARKSRQQPKMVTPGKRRQRRVRVVYITPDARPMNDRTRRSRPDIYSDEPFEEYKNKERLTPEEQARRDLEDIFGSNDHNDEK